jgi:hypothetical protein
VRWEQACANGCGRPAHIDGLCASCWRGQTPRQRAVNAVSVELEGYMTAVEPDPLIAELDALWDLPSASG